MSYDYTIKIPEGMKMSEMKFEYATISFTLTPRIDYDEYKRIQPWPFNSPWSVDENRC